MTPELLRAAIGCSAARAAECAPYFDEACRVYNINTDARLAAFLAQIGHESMSLVHAREVWGPTTTQMGYEGRTDLGNHRPGDGSLYRGRGFIQTTGRYNYQRVRDRLRDRGFDAPDFEARPHLLEDSRWAVLSAADYWDMRGLNTLADAGQFDRISRAINRGNANSRHEANGTEDRNRRWATAKEALAALAAAAQPTPAPTTASLPLEPTPEITEEPAMPLPAIIGALLPTLISSIDIPKLAEMFKPGVPVAERNVKVATTVFEVAKVALGAKNEQEVIERLAADPVAAGTVKKAVEANWFLIDESGGGGIGGARQADATFVASGEPVWKSPSFVLAMALMPLVYMIVLNVVGVLGKPLSDEVRSAIANGVVGIVLGGLIGYYYGQTTSRNRPRHPTE